MIVCEWGCSSLWIVRTYRTKACRPVAPSWTVGKETRNPKRAESPKNTNSLQTCHLYLVKTKKFSQPDYLSSLFDVFFLVDITHLINNANTKLLYQNNMVSALFLLKYGQFGLFTFQDFNFLKIIDLVCVCVCLSLFRGQILSQSALWSG